MPRELRRLAGLDFGLTKFSAVWAYTPNVASFASLEPVHAGDDRFHDFIVKLVFTLRADAPVFIFQFDADKHGFPLFLREAEEIPGVGLGTDVRYITVVFRLIERSQWVVDDVAGCVSVEIREERRA